MQTKHVATSNMEVCDFCFGCKYDKIDGRYLGLPTYLFHRMDAHEGNAFLQPFAYYAYLDEFAELPIPNDPHSHSAYYNTYGEYENPLELGHEKARRPVYVLDIAFVLRHASSSIYHNPFGRLILSKLYNRCSALLNALLFGSGVIRRVSYNLTYVPPSRKGYF